MRGRYLIRNPLAATVLRSLDFFFDALPSSRSAPPASPRRILVCNWAHLGDVLLTLPATAWLRERFPDAGLGFLGGSWATPILDDVAAGFDTVHTIDHFNLSRSGDLAERVAQHRRTAAVAIPALRRAGYDMAIDFYPFFPSAGFSLWRAGIPVRVGWTSGGLGGFYTHRVRRMDCERHVIDQTRDILARVVPDQPPGAGSLRPIYRRDRPRRSLPAPLNDGKPYVLMHTGTRQPTREWPHERWIALAQRLQKDSRRVVLLGSGPREAQRNAAIAAAVPGVVDLTGAFDWPGLVDVIETCEHLFCLESVAGHLAAVFDRPTTVIFGGMTNPRQWGPMSPRAATVTHPTPCAPCNRWGCEGMYCLAGVDVDDVVGAFAGGSGALPVINVQRPG